MRIKSNLKEIADKQGLSALQLSKEIDYRYESVRVMFNDTAKHYPKELIRRLCERLDVTPGDIIVVEDEKEPQE